MGLFRKKTISERIKKKWITKTCSLSQLKTILLEDDLIEFWVKYGETYFQVGCSSDFSKRKGFFDKIYFINLHTDLNLFALLNNSISDKGFFASKEMEALFSIPWVDDKPLAEIWSNCVIVGVSFGDDAINPDDYLVI